VSVHPARPNGPATRPNGRFLYCWLLLALFIEYARPTVQLTWLEIPYLYSIVPLTLVLATMFSKSLRPAKTIFEDSMSKWVLILFTIIAASFMATGFNGTARVVFETVLGYVLLFIVIARIVTTSERLRGVVIVLSLAHLYLLAVNFQVLTNPSERQYLVGGTFLGDGNDFALSLCILFPCMVGVSVSSRSLPGKLFAGAGAVVITLAIVATQSRGGSLGLAAVLFYLWARSSRKAVSGIGIAIVVASMLIYAPPAYFERMGSVGGATLDGSAQGRLDAWSGAIGMAAHNPLFGIGPGQFSTIWGITAHSTYMLAFAELGIPGFLAVLMLVFGNIRASARRRAEEIARAGLKSRGPVTPSVQMLDMMNAGAVGFAVAGAFLSATYYPHMYVLTGLLVSARILATSQSGHSATKRA
jgi:putative inorganic carbon (hco3(-)) transporter